MVAAPRRLSSNPRRARATVSVGTSPRCMVPAIAPAGGPRTQRRGGPGFCNSLEEARGVGRFVTHHRSSYSLNLRPTKPWGVSMRRLLKSLSCFCSRRRLYRWQVRIPGVVYVYVESLAILRTVANPEAPILTATPWPVMLTPCLSTDGV